MDIVIENLSKSFKRVNALDSITLTLSPGIHGLLGPNGAGKSTLMRILATILDEDSGRIYCGNNLDWKDPMEIKKIVGYLPQSFGMYKFLSVEEALKSVAIFKNIDVSKEYEYISLAMERTNLTHLAKRKVAQLSGGMLRRLGIAQAILGDPPLLILDEPSVGLDPVERINLRKLIRDYNNGERIILISSHIVGDIESLCSTVTVMNKGKVLASGSLNKIQNIAAGHVAEKEMSESEFRILEEKASIINFISVGNEYRVRYLVQSDMEGISVPPTLEDSYTFIIEQDDRI